MLLQHHWHLCLYSKSHQDTYFVHPAVCIVWAGCELVCHYCHVDDKHVTLTRRVGSSIQSAVDAFDFFFCGLTVYTAMTDV
eukprot:2262186-Pleurochrysis_carterae.AAC.4